MTEPQATLKSARKFPRYRCNQKLRIRYRVDNCDQLAFGRCTMVGKGGIGAVIAAELALGQVVQLELAIPTNPASRALKAQVKNRKGSNYGFQFLETDLRN